MTFSKNRIKTLLKKKINYKVEKKLRKNIGKIKKGANQPVLEEKK